MLCRKQKKTARPCLAFVILAEWESINLSASHSLSKIDHPQATCAVRPPEEIADCSIFSRDDQYDRQSQMTNVSRECCRGHYRCIARIVRSVILPHYTCIILPYITCNLYFPSHPPLPPYF